MCYRHKKGKLQVLLVTTSNGRWIIPKGWPIDGLHAYQAALQEAWEEAGVRHGNAEKDAIGSYKSIKRFDNGQEIPCETLVFRVEVTDLAEEYPEDEMRERQWVSPKKAASLVSEDGLRDILLGLEEIV